MSRHWRPDRSDWTVIENYCESERKIRRGALSLVLGAVALGLIGGGAWQRWNAPRAAADASAVELNAVQAVSTRMSITVVETAWEKRAGAPERPRKMRHFL